MSSNATATPTPAADAAAAPATAPAAAPATGSATAAPAGPATAAPAASGNGSFQSASLYDVFVNGRGPLELTGGTDISADISRTFHRPLMDISRTFHN